MRSARRRVAAAVTVGGLALGSVAATMTVASGAPVVRAKAANAAGAAADPAIVWGECSDPELKALECGTLDVPLDYENPSGETLELAVSRMRSSDPGRRRGVLLLNPGGPGAAGLGMPATMAADGLPASVMKSYDLIGFDPRGVGKSSPISCGLSPEQMTSVFSRFAHDREDVAKQADIAAGIAEQCVAKDGARLPYLTTRNTARDMDRIRAALGEERISYYGTSYGTYLGSVYAQMFPERSDRFVLDSAVDPGMVWRDVFRSWGAGMEIRFPDFARWAAKRHGTYELGRTPGEVRRTYLELAGRLDQEPAAGLDGTGFRQLTRVLLYSDGAFPQIAQVWQGLGRGDAAAVERHRAKAAPPVLDENFFSAAVAIQCGDVAWPTSLEHYQRAVAVDRKRFPLVGAMTANIGPCARWPLAPKEKLTEISDDGPSNILIVQNLRDPATIYPGAVRLRRTLGDRARMVTVDAGEHGAYVAGNACVDNLTTRYLVTGVRPGRDRFCAADAGRAPEDERLVDPARGLTGHVGVIARLAGT